MAEELERLKSFRAFLKATDEGAAVPPVGEDDLKKLHQLSLDMAKRYCGKDGVVTLNQMTRICRPEANLAALWARHSQLRLLTRHGLLAEWQHGSELDDIVYRVAATIPMKGYEWDREAFLQRLRSEVPA